MITARPHLDTLLDMAIKTGGESLEFDFKETLDPSVLQHRLKLVKIIAAFANTDRGGYLIIGVSDSFEIKGVKPAVAAKYDQTDLQKLLKKYIAPTPRFQIRHHERDGKRLIIIEIYPFLEVPHVIVAGSTGAGSKLEPGIIYVRTLGAECTPVTSETEMRRLCEAITKRHANRFLELMQRGLASLPGSRAVGQTVPAALAEARKSADTHWLEAADQNEPYIEVFFEPASLMRLCLSEMKSIIPQACVPGESFPFTEVSGVKMYKLEDFGWLGIIPLKPPQPVYAGHPTPKEEKDETKPAGEPSSKFLWLFDRNAAFLYRNPLWEDEKNSPMQGGIGLYHVIGLLILNIRFLHRTALILGLGRDSHFHIGVKLAHIASRFLDIETRQKIYRRTATSQQFIEVSLPISIGQLLEFRVETVVALIEEVCWQFGLTSFTREQLINIVLAAPKHLGSTYQFPEQETL